MKKIWKKKVFFDGLKLFLLFLLLFILTYVFVDFSIRGSKLGRLPLVQILVYYLSQIAFSLEVFIPLSFLFALVTVLSRMNRHRELIAFQIAGLSKAKLISPLFFLTVLISFFSFINENHLIPLSSKNNQEYQDSSLKLKDTGSIQSIRLEDKSHLIYLHFSNETNEANDVFLIRSFSDIWHIDQLMVAPLFLGKNVDHFVRDDNFNLIKTDSYETYEFKDLKVDKRSFQETFTPYENRSLYSLISHKFFASKKEKVSIKTMLHYKAVMVFLPFIIFLAIPPFCMKYSRDFTSFKILAISLFTFACFFAALNAVVLLCENQMISPLIGCWTIPLCLLSLGFLKSIRVYFRLG
ncbi:MAG: LptF/LptG family permease [Chlamydiota bacterium]|jgi:lipopolysaccharide export LptBFGC system permease protein LptF